MKCLHKEGFCSICDKLRGYSISDNPIPASRKDLEDDEKDIKEEKYYGWGR